MTGYYDMPWVKPFVSWLQNQGPEILAVICVAIGIVSIVIGLLAPTWLKLLWAVYMLSP